MLMGRSPFAQSPPRYLLDRAGNRDARTPSAAAVGSSNRGLTFGPGNYINLTSPWARALGIAGHVAPLPYGAVLGAANLAMRGYNTLNTNAIRRSLGMAPLHFGQTVGALLGLNDYATGGNTLISRSDAAAPAVHPMTGAPIGVSTGGLLDEGSWGPFGLFGTENLRTHLTPQELNLRQILARAQALNGGQGPMPRSAAAVKEPRTGLLSGAFKQAAHYGNERGGGGGGGRGYGPSGERGPGGMLSGADKKSAHY